MDLLGYTRVSTREQARDGLSLIVQRQKLELYAKLHEHNLVEVIEERGETGKNLDRPGMDRLRELLRSGKVGGVLIYKLDRLTRKLRDWNTLIDDHFSEKKGSTGSKLMSVNDHIDTTTANGRIMLNLLMSIAQWEVEVISERTTIAITEKRQTNQRHGRLRYGWDPDPSGPKHPKSGLPMQLIPNDDEQLIIETMRAWRAEGMAYRVIANQLASRGIPTKEGKRWHTETVKKILTWSVPDVDAS